MFCSLRISFGIYLVLVYISLPGRLLFILYRYSDRTTAFFDSTLIVHQQNSRWRIAGGKQNPIHHELSGTFIAIIEKLCVRSIEKNAKCL